MKTSFLVWWLVIITRTAFNDTEFGIRCVVILYVVAIMYALLQSIKFIISKNAESCYISHKEKIDFPIYDNSIFFLNG